MATISATAFAKYVGCSQPSVVQAIRSGRVHDDGHGVDLDHATNVSFCEQQALRRATNGLPPSPWSRGEPPPPHRGPGRPLAKRTPKAATKPKPRSKPPPKAAGELAPAELEPEPESETEPEPDIGVRPESVKRDAEMRALAVGIKELDLEKKRTNLEQERLKLRTANGSLIAMSIVSRSLARLGGVLEDQLRSFGERNAAALLAAFQAGSQEGKIADLLDFQIDQAVTSFKRAAVRELETIQVGPGGK